MSSRLMFPRLSLLSNMQLANGLFDVIYRDVRVLWAPIESRKDERIQYLPFPSTDN